MKTKIYMVAYTSHTDINNWQDSIYTDENCFNNLEDAMEQYEADKEDALLSAHNPEEYDVDDPDYEKGTYVYQETETTDHSSNGEKLPCYVVTSERGYVAKVEIKVLEVELPGSTTKDYLDDVDDEEDKPEPAGGYVRAHRNDNEIIAVREDGSGVIVYAHNQEWMDELVTFENLVEYLKDASSLPESYETYEDWASDCWSAGDQYQILCGDYVSDDEWEWICYLAGISSEEYPYNELSASGANIAQYMPEAA